MATKLSPVDFLESIQVVPRRVVERREELVAGAACVHACKHARVHARLPIASMRMQPE